jgi:hypothetical protein
VTTQIDTDFPYQIILTEKLLVRGYWHHPGATWTAVGWDMELNAYVTNGGCLIEAKSSVRATPELLKQAKAARLEREAKREARRQEYEDRQAAKAIPPKGFYDDNPNYGRF